MAESSESPSPLESPNLDSQATSTSTPARGGLRCGYLKRFWLQIDPWMRYFRRHILAFFFVQALLMIVVACFCLRMFTDVFRPDEIHWFTLGGSILYTFRFIFMWLAIPDGPPYMADEYGTPLYFEMDDPEFLKQSFPAAEVVIEA